MIRPATVEDEPAIRACAAEAYAPYIPLIGREPAPMQADFGTQIATGQAHVAEDELGRLLGYLVCFPQDGQMLLESVAVMKAAAGKGIGKSLIRFCEAEAVRLGLDGVRLYTNVKMVDNLGMYPRLGYRETSRGVENGFERVFFEKSLVG